MPGFIHPVTIVYAFSFVSMFVWPMATPEETGEPCRDIASDWFIMIMGIFANTLVHSIYCLWLIERVVHDFSKHRVPGPMLEMGEAIARGGTFGSWSTYFGIRFVIPALVTLILYAAEHKCILHYGQLLGSVLITDTAFTFLMFAASWSMERLSKDSAKTAAAAKKTLEAGGDGKKGDGKKGEEKEMKLVEDKKSD